MILSAFLKAIGQMSDPRFRRVLLLGVGLTILLLAAVYGGLLWLLNWAVPDSFALPWIGEITWIDDFLSGASILAMLVASIFLMVPVASLFTSIFLDDVADAVEAKHYPQMGPSPSVPFWTSVRDGLGFLGVIVVVNLVALIVYLIAGPLAPFVFVAVNGYLLGREYFQLIALRRLGRDGAARAQRRHRGTIALAGVLMAAPLTVPVLNLLVPIVGAATFTHLFHRLEGPSARTSPDPGR